MVITLCTVQCTYCCIRPNFRPTNGIKLQKQNDQICWIWSEMRKHYVMNDLKLILQLTKKLFFITKLGGRGRPRFTSPSFLCFPQFLSYCYQGTSTPDPRAASVRALETSWRVRVSLGTEVANRIAVWRSSNWTLHQISVQHGLIHC